MQVHKTILQDRHKNINLIWRRIVTPQCISNNNGRYTPLDLGRRIPEMIVPMASIHTVKYNKIFYTDSNEKSFFIINLQKLSKSH